jgi:hypothetical protein
VIADGRLISRGRGVIADGRLISGGRGVIANGRSLRPAGLRGGFLMAGRAKERQARTGGDVVRSVFISVSSSLIPFIGLQKLCL